jgi:CheY-like chemotaxis protein
MTSGAAPVPDRILIADDLAEHRALIEAALHPHYRVIVAHDGKELYDLLFGMPPRHFAAVVCDVFMPGLRGTEVLARASSRSRFILVTASNDVRIDETASGFGAAALLRKPFDPHVLRDLVDRVVEGTPPPGIRAPWKRSA